MAFEASKTTKPWIFSEPAASGSGCAALSGCAGASGASGGASAPKRGALVVIASMINSLGIIVIFLFVYLLL